VPQQVDLGDQPDPVFAAGVDDRFDVLLFKGILPHQLRPRSKTITEVDPQDEGVHTGRRQFLINQGDKFTHVVMGRSRHTKSPHRNKFLSRGLHGRDNQGGHQQEGPQKYRFFHLQVQFKV